MSGAASVTRRTHCSDGSRPCRTCKPRGCFCCFVPRPEPTTCSACFPGCLRTLPGHAVQGCLSAPRPSPRPALARASAADAPRASPLWRAGAVATAPAAYWASWADCLPAIRARAPAVAARLLQNLQAEGPEAAAPLAAAQQAATYLRGQGYGVPDWGSTQVEAQASVEREFGEPLRGWQQLAAAAGDERALELHLSHLDAASRALLLSQAGPHAARALTVFPTSPELAVASPQFRVILLRRLRLALPVAPRACACRGRLDPLGDNRAACANAGVLASRALPLERAIAHVCQVAGARVARNVRLADMNIDVPVSDDRRIEVVANGLPLWHGSQQAMDATIVSPVTRAGEAQPGADARPGQALVGAARASDAKRTPSLCAPVAAAWWSLVSKSEAGSVPKLPRGYACLRATVRLRPPGPHCSIPECAPDRRS